MKYIVTGGLGFIGSVLSNILKGSIKVVSRSDKQIKRLKNKEATLLIKPIQKLEVRDIEGADVIYHLASTVDNYHVLDDPYIDTETNINGTVHLLELCKDLKKKPKFIYLSTFFVYGNTYDKTKRPITEESATDPLALYPATKLCAESIIKLYGRLHKIPYLICRPTNVFGEYEDFNNKKKGALNFIIMQALRGEELHIYSGGNFIRDYIYVNDVVDALMLLEKKSVNETFLIGSGKPIEFKLLIKYILKYSKSFSKIVEISPPFFHSVVGITNFVADISKLKKMGWSPKISPEEGIKRIITRYKSLLETI